MQFDHFAVDLRHFRIKPRRCQPEQRIGEKRNCRPVIRWINIRLETVFLSIKFPFDGLKVGDFNLQSLGTYIFCQPPHAAQCGFRVVAQPPGVTDIAVFQKDIPVFQKQEITRTLAVGGVEIKEYFAFAEFPQMPHHLFQIVFSFLGSGHYRVNLPHRRLWRLWRYDQIRSADVLLKNPRILWSCGGCL